VTDDEQQSVLRLVEDEITRFLQWEIDLGPYDPHSVAVAIAANLARKLEAMVNGWGI
jgi:hypothetical protein